MSDREEQVHKIAHRRTIAAFSDMWDWFHKVTLNMPKKYLINKEKTEIIEVIEDARVVELRDHITARQKKYYEEQLKEFSVHQESK